MIQKETKNKSFNNIFFLNCKILACENCDLRSSYCKRFDNGTQSCECRAGFKRQGSTGKCVIDSETRVMDQQQLGGHKDPPVLYTEDGEKCVLGQAEKHATR